jgi:hypothetical protein
MRGRREIRARRVSVFVLLLAAVVGLSACGGSTDSGTSELARQQELAEARNQAAQDARQSAHIKELERRLRSIARENRNGSSTEVSPTPSDTTGQPSEPEQESDLGDWPGGSGFTAILASLPSEAEAASTQADATTRGLDAGVLYSSNFSSLRPGYWVVFSGAFPNASGAAARTRRAHELGFADAYPRFVSP